MSHIGRHLAAPTARWSPRLVCGLMTAVLLAAALPAAADSGVTVSFSIRLEGIVTPVASTSAPSPATAARAGEALGTLLAAVDRSTTDRAGDAGGLHRRLAGDAVLWLDGAAFSTTAAAVPVWTSRQADRADAHLSL